MKRSVIFTFCILIGGVTGCSQSTIQKQESKSKMELASDSWTVTPPFDLLVTAADGDNVNYRILGQPDTFGFTHSPLVANKPHKSLWFYFGEEKILDVPIQIKAVKKGSNKIDTLHTGSFYEGAEAGPDTINMPSLLTFPSSGTWQVLVYADKVLKETLVVEVN
ncbi:hypothetical protein [Rossellomorea marisflavi]|uniref:hypothetical protein n=1 Tax=Rossellomorea marisflavi TaxID=189381 RepID=UPI00064FD950|nr:hypothetical protein [Rossellomorea marisflavi]KML31216.1 hypothetical protein VL12_17855 [Rossellomorea marisflavi]